MCVCACVCVRDKPHSHSCCVKRLYNLTVNGTSCFTIRIVPSDNFLPRKRGKGNFKRWDYFMRSTSYRWIFFTVFHLQNLFSFLWFSLVFQSDSFKFHWPQKVANSRFLMSSHHHLARMPQMIHARHAYTHKHTKCSIPSIENISNLKINFHKISIFLLLFVVVVALPQRTAWRLC